MDLVASQETVEFHTHPPNPLPAAHLGLRALGLRLHEAHEGGQQVIGPLLGPAHRGPAAGRAAGGATAAGRACRQGNTQSGAGLDAWDEILQPDAHTCSGDGVNAWHAHAPQAGCSADAPTCLPGRPAAWRPWRARPLPPPARLPGLRAPPRTRPAAAPPPPTPQAATRRPAGHGGRQAWGGEGRWQPSALGHGLDTSFSSNLATHTEHTQTSLSHPLELAWMKAPPAGWLPEVGRREMMRGLPARRARSICAQGATDRRRVRACQRPPTSREGNLLLLYPLIMAYHPCSSHAVQPLT